MQEYFYLEPYTYMNVKENGVLLINLIDDNAYIFNDEESLKIARDLLLSAHNTIPLKNYSTNIPLVEKAINYFLGGIVSSNFQPIQFQNGINIIKGKEAYLKSINYTKNNLGAMIRECTLFVDMSSRDVSECISYIKGIDNEPLMAHRKESLHNLLDRTCEQISILLQINPDIKINVCGVNLSLIKMLNKRFPILKINYIFTLETAKVEEEISEYILKNNQKYTILIDDSLKNIEDSSILRNGTLWVKISNETDFYFFESLLKLRYNALFFPVLSSGNYDFIKSFMKYTTTDLLDLENKFRNIKMNNLINSNLWGKIYCFSNGSCHYSLDDISHTPANKLSIQDFYNDYVLNLKSGEIRWRKIRDYKKCSSCYFQYLCPSPSYLEDKLRTEHCLDCLILNSNEQ